MKLLKTLRQRSGPRSAEQKGGTAQALKRRGRLVTALLVLLALMAGFRLAFPEKPLVEMVQARLYQETGVQFSSRESALGFPLSVCLKGVRLASRQWVVPDELESVCLSPAWRRLLLGSPGLVIEVAGFDGEARALVESDGGVDVVLNGVELARLARLPGDYRISGIVEGTLRGTLKPQPELAWRLTLESLNLSGLEELGIDDSVPLGRLEGHGSFKGRNLVAEELRLGGGALDGEGSGSLIAGTSLRTSRVSAAVKLRPRPQLPGILQELVKLRSPQADPQGWYGFRLNGRLDAPTLR